MTEVLPAEFADLWGADRARQNAAYESMMAATERPVPWADAAWAEVPGHLADKDNHNRAIAGQLLCALASTDDLVRVRGHLDALLTVTRDPRFVTARHTIRSLWRIGLAGEEQRRLLLATVDRRYRAAAGEKNGTLIRSDLIEGLRRLSDATGDNDVSRTAEALIELEEDPKYRRKYAGHWK